MSRENMYDWMRDSSRAVEDVEQIMVQLSTRLHDAGHHVWCDYIGGRFRLRDFDDLELVHFETTNTYDFINRVVDLLEGSNNEEKEA